MHALMTDDAILWMRIDGTTSRLDSLERTDRLLFPLGLLLTRKKRKESNQLLIRMTKENVVRFPFESSEDLYSFT